MVCPIDDEPLHLSDGTVSGVDVLATACVGVAGAATVANHDDARKDRLAPTSRGPPTQGCDSPGRRHQCPSHPIDSQLRAVPPVPACRRPGRTRPMLDPTTTTDYNYRSTPTPAERTTGPDHR